MSVYFVIRNLCLFGCEVVDYATQQRFDFDVLSYAFFCTLKNGSSGCGGFYETNLCSTNLGIELMYFISRLYIGTILITLNKDQSLLQRQL